MGLVQLKDVLGAKVKHYRLQAGMTQATLSQRSGLFRTHVSRIECGTANPTLTAIVALAKALGVEPSVLLMDPSEQPTHND
jgi:transcriptional regulator with XRE-family HTH domain